MICCKCSLFRVYQNDLDFSSHCLFCETHNTTESFVRFNNGFVSKIGTSEATWEWMKSQLLNEPRGQSRRRGDIMTWSPRLDQCWHDFPVWLTVSSRDIPNGQLTGVMDNHRIRWEMAKLSPFELKAHDDAYFVTKSFCCFALPAFYLFFTFRFVLNMLPVLFKHTAVPSIGGNAGKYV